MAAQKAIFILGMHRSGTSAATRVLNLLGMAIGPHLLPAGPDNPKGYWEHRDVVAVHDEVFSRLCSWPEDPRPLPDRWWKLIQFDSLRERLAGFRDRDFRDEPCWGIKDPRLCRMLPLWRGLDWVDRSAGVIIVIRSPVEVAESLAARDGFSTDYSLLLWLRYVLESVRNSKEFPRAIVSYASLLADWRREISRVSKSLDIPFDKSITSHQAEIDLFIDPELRHHDAGAKIMRDRPGKSGSDYILSLAQQVFTDISAAAENLSILDSPEFERWIEALDGLMQESAITGVLDEILTARCRLNGKLEKSISNMRVEFDQQDQNIQTLREDVSAYQRTVEELSDRLAAVRKLEVDLQACNLRIVELEQALHVRNLRVADLEAGVHQQNLRIMSLEPELDRQNLRIMNLEPELDRQNLRVMSLEPELDRQYHRVIALETDLHSQNLRVMSLEAERAAKDLFINNLMVNLEQARGEIGVLSAQLVSANDELERCRDNIAVLSAQLLTANDELERYRWIRKLDRFFFRR